MLTKLFPAILLAVALGQAACSEDINPAVPSNPNPVTETFTGTGSGRILLADDDETVREVVTRMLHQLGYEVEEAVDGTEAVERISRDPSRYDLVILDGNMPRLHGRDAAMLIKDLAPELRLILATGYLEPGDSERLEVYGFSASIAKPYSISELSRVVAQQLAMAK